MEFEKLVLERRSIRGYKEQKVSKELVLEILKTCTYAPSWKNSLTARYYVALSPEMNEKVLAGLPEFNQLNASNACLVVTTFVTKRAGFDKEANQVNEVGDGWGYYDLGLNNAYFVLKAKELGLDTLIMGIRDEKTLKEAFNVPDSEKIVSVIALGYGDKLPTSFERKPYEKLIGNIL